ncbi:integrase core domain-containing protein [Streptomyces bobili]
MLGLHRRDAPLRSALRGPDGQRQAVHRPPYPPPAGGGALRAHLSGERHHPAAAQTRSPTTTGKIERFHRTLREEFLDHVVPFESLAAAQEAIDGWVHAYNHQRPHQALNMATPISLFRPHTAVGRDHQHPEQTVAEPELSVEVVEPP